MSKKFVIIHGTGGSPEGNWFPWLSDKLHAMGHMCVVPRMPTPNNQTLSNWFKALDSEVWGLNEDTVLIGHGIGVAFCLRVLEEESVSLDAAYLVAGFTRQLGLPDFDPLNKTFLENPFNWEKIRETAGSFHVYAGEGDPYVPLDQSEEIAKQLHVPLTIVPNGKHLNAEAGFTTADFILKDIK